MNDDCVQLDGNKRNVFYVYLPNHPGDEIPSVVSSSLRLRDLFVQIDRPDLLQLLGDADMILDCGEDGKLIGVEILT